MEIPVTQLPPGDPRLVEAIVGQLKSKGIFDQFRKECLADVDTKPAFQNLRQRVEGHVNKYLEKKTWKNDMNKNQLRDGVRKHVHSLGILESGIDAIITQVVNPKIKPLILPYVEDTVYAFLQIDKPKRERKTSEPHISPVPLEPEEEQQINYEQQQHEEEQEGEQEVEEEEEEEDEKSTAKPVEESKPSLLPMETDVISSEEDDILARESPEALSKSSSNSEAEDVKPMDENAQDGFDSCPPNQEDASSDITANVERLQLSEDDSKSPQATKQPLPLFEDQSLDSISSNTSGLSLSPLSVKGSPESKKSNEEAIGTDESPRAEVRSATSTPLVDEKPVDESSHSSLESNHSKDYHSSAMHVEQDASNLASGAEHSTQFTKEGTSLMSFDEDSIESKGSLKVSETSVKSEAEERVKSEKSEGEISSSSEVSDGDIKPNIDLTPIEEKQRSDQDMSHKSSRSKSDHKKRRDSHSRDRDRDREREKDSKHHREKERKHSKSRDDHHSHRDKDKKHHRRDKDHDGDRDRSRSHHHQSSSSSHKERLGSKEKDRSSSNHHSSGKSSDGKGRSNQSGEKSEGKPTDKMEINSDIKSESKSQKKDDKHSQSSDRKSDKSSGKGEKSDKKNDKPDRKSDKKESSDDKQNKKQEKKPDSKMGSKSEGKTNDLEVEGKKKKIKTESRERSSRSTSELSSMLKKKESNERDSKDSKKSLAHESDKMPSDDDDDEDEAKCEEIQTDIGVLETIETTIDPQMLGLTKDNIIVPVADDEGNLMMLLTYEDDTDSISSCSQEAIKLENISLLPTPEESVDEETSNYFEGFQNVKPDMKLRNYLQNMVRIPDEIDMEYSEWLDNSDLHMTLYENEWNEKVSLGNFLKSMQQLGAIIRNEKGEIEDHALPIDIPPPADVKENNNIPIGKKRRLSNSSSISSGSSSTGSPKHKRLRRDNSTVSDTNQLLEEDAVIVSGYALLTPEDDGNRSLSREYDLDYSQKISNYSPLSPSSDSSADERKGKGRGTVLDPRRAIVKASSKREQKTDTSWPRNETNLSV